jgi:23S rRNA (guanosine2251-2'-O)-methyltransferase
MYIEGRNAILESLRSNRKFRKLFVQDQINKDEKIKQILSKAKNRDIGIKYLSKKHLDQKSVTGHHQGVVAWVWDKEELDLNSYLENMDLENPPFLVYIREAQHQYNIGAIARSAECAGANGVIVPPKTRIQAEAVKASTGAIEHIDIYEESLFSAIKIAKNHDIKVVGIEVSGEKFYYEQDLSGPVMLIIGGEDRPLSLEILKKCDIIVRIPLRGKINSLNMSVAASIVMYDKVRQEAILKK